MEDRFVDMGTVDVLLGFGKGLINLCGIVSYVGRTSMDLAQDIYRPWVTDIPMLRRL